MTRNLIALTAVLASLTTLAAQTPRTVVVRAARMLDPVTGRIVANPVVIIAGDRIQALGGASPAGATTIDLGDLTLLPGLIDAHTHNLLEPEDEITPPILTKSQGRNRVCRTGPRRSQATVQRTMTSDATHDRRPTTHD